MCSSSRSVMWLPDPTFLDFCSSTFVFSFVSFGFSSLQTAAAMRMFLAVNRLKSKYSNNPTIQVHLVTFAVESDDLLFHLVITIKRFHSRGERSYWLTETKEIICLKVGLIWYTNMTAVSLCENRHSIMT